MRHRTIHAAVPLACLAVLVMASSASATILTFDPHTGNGAPVAVGYGDNVAGSPQGGLVYGVGAEGHTPDVTVDYGLGLGTVHQWDAGYGDLTNVIYREEETSGILRVVFTAAPGWHAVLHDMDLAGWSNSYTITYVDVRDGDDNVLFHQDAVGAPNGPTRNTLAFGAIGARTLTLDVRIDLDGSSDNIGLDNIRFGQVPDPSLVVPELPALPLVALSLGAIAAVALVVRRQRPDA